jgi:zinc transport system substrate-binding protein
MKKIKIFVFSFLLIGILFSGIVVQAANNSDDLTVAVSIVPQATFVEAVAGELVDVATMVPPGNSPANYSPSPDELMKFADSSIYFSMGVPTDMANILPEAKDINPDIKIVKLFEEVDKVYPPREIAPGKRDPYIWLSPKRVKVMVNIITEELSKLDPVNKDIYQKNARSYLDKLDKLDQDIRESLKGVKNRTFIVYHPAFGYFADEYDLKMLAIEKKGKDAAPRTVQDIIDTAKNKNIKVIFYQAEIDSKQSQAIAESIGGKTIKLAPLAPNYIENLKKTAEIFNEVLN